MINETTQYGAFRGRKLIQQRGEIGGTRQVFVKVKGIKNQLVYPTFGGKVMNPPKGQGFKMFAGDLCWYKTDANGVNPEIYLLKTFLVESVSGSVVNIVRDGYKHVPFIGDVIGVAPEQVGGAMTGSTITKVVATKVGDVPVWACTVSKAITAEKGAVLVEANAEGNKMLVEQINGVVDADADMLDAGATVDNKFDGARYHYTPALGGIMYIHKMSPMPACVLALNEAKVNGWFQIQSV
jgi:hypothetical protein